MLKDLPLLTVTARGFTLLKFKDVYDQPCSLQKSSIMTPECIWLGVETSIDLNTKEVLGDNQRMHLSQAQVQELLPYLIRFAKTGQLTN